MQLISLIKGFLYKLGRSFIQLLLIVFIGLPVAGLMLIFHFLSQVFFPVIPKNKKRLPRRNNIHPRLDSLIRVLEAPADPDNFCPQLDFLIQVLQAIVESIGNPKLVYPLLQANLGKLDDNLANILHTWATAKLSEAKPETAEDIALVIGEFSRIISEFTLGNKANNMEIAIAGYKETLKVLKRDSTPEIWADTQNNFGVAYMNRIKGDRAENMEMAIAAYNQALEVRTEESLPTYWAETQNNLGNAYSYRIKGSKAENLKMAIDAFHKALKIYTKDAFPTKWAQIQNNLGAAYNDAMVADKGENLDLAIADGIIGDSKENNRRINGDRAENLENAIAAFKQALKVRKKGTLPIEWATTQNNLGLAYYYRINGDPAENLKMAIDAFNQALEVRTEEALPTYWATTQSNLGAAYSHRILRDRANNLETAIACYKKALQVYTPEADPIKSISSSRSLGNLYFHQHNWQKAIETYETAITAVELSRSWATTDDRREKIMTEAIDVYHKQVQTYINIGQWDKAIETVERSKARNLVELLANRDLYPKGDVPQGIRAQLDRLRRKTILLEKKLQVATDQLSGNTDEQQRPSLEKSQKRRQQELQQSRQQLDGVLAQIKHYDSSFSLTQKVEQIPFGDIQGLIDDRTALIEWYITEDKILTLIVTRSLTLDVWQSEPRDLQALNNWLDEYLQDYNQPRKKQWSDNLASRLQRLAAILHLEEILNRVPQHCQQVILIPHRLLHLLPLHALPLPNQPDKCLLDRFPQGVRYDPSCQLLQLTQNWERPHFSDLFGIQNPDRNLTYASLQMQIIRQQFDSAEVLVEAAASKAALMNEGHYKNQLRNSHCLHFACHGEFKEDSPLESSLKLANKEPLTLGEIFGLNIDRCRLVTLSACETGLTDRKSITDEYISLPSGFLFAGGLSIISSLWKVDELATAFLMIKFYENLSKRPRRETGDVAIALNQAQIWLRNLTHAEFEECRKQFMPQIEQILAPLSKGKRRIVEGQLNNASDRQPRPFASPFYWSGFIATGR